MSGRGPWILIVAAAVSLATASSAAAATGDLTYRDCVTRESESGPSGSRACSESGGSTGAGVDSGLDGPESVAVSPDGRSIYAVSGDDDALMQLDRDPVTGILTIVACISGELQTVSAAGCSPIPQTQSQGTDSGLDDPESVTVSPDGISVYVTTRGDDSIVRFNRNPATGAIAFAGCITGRSESNAACTAIAPLPGGTDSGFDDLKTKEVAISADGRSLYAGSELDDAVLSFDRNPFTGALSYSGCISGERQTGPGPVGSDHCALIGSAGAVNLGQNSGLDSVRWIELSPDDRSLYVLAQDDDSVARFDRDRATGALTYVGCITAEDESGPGPGSGACAKIPSASPSGANSGLDDPRGIDVSAGGTSVVVASGNDSAVARFDRDPATGALTYRDCVSGETASTSCAQVPGATATGSGSGLHGIRDLELSPDDRSVYLAAQFDGSIAEFVREPTTGAVALSACHTGNLALVACSAIPTATPSGDNSGLFDPETLALAADGASLYANVEADSAIARFDRVPFVAPPAPDTTSPDTAVTARPKPNTKRRRATFSFLSSESGSSFECALDRGDFLPCASPRTTKRLRRRRHTFQVRAIDAVGNVDPTPATANWKVRRKKRGG